MVRQKCPVESTPTDFERRKSHSVRTLVANTARRSLDRCQIRHGARGLPRVPHRRRTHSRETPDVDDVEVRAGAHDQAQDQGYARAPGTSLLLRTAGATRAPQTRLLPRTASATRARSNAGFSAVAGSDAVKPKKNVKDGIFEWRAGSVFSTFD